MVERAAAANAAHNIFTSLRPASVVAERAQRSRGPLQGMLMAVKDNICTTEEPTTCGLKMLQNYTLPFAATCVELLEQAGATTVGKTNMDEFGMGSANTHLVFGTTTNPVTPERVVGGSSGGSAAAVAAGAVDFALGTDTGGLVRCPAAHTGVVGFKPLYGRISRHGVVPYAQSLDTVGILAREVSKVEQVFGVVDKHDPRDPTSTSAAVRAAWDRLRTERPLVVGIPLEFNVADLTPVVREAWTHTLQQLLREGHEIRPVLVPGVREALPVYYTLALAEAALNLARYDGIRYGFRADSDGPLFAATRSQGFGAEVQRRILLGNRGLSADHMANHFLRARVKRQELAADFDAVFRRNRTGQDAEEAAVDVLITPTQALLAHGLEDYVACDESDPLVGYTNDVLTVPALLAGLPSVSVPVAISSGLPTGVQVMGQHGDDRTVLAFAARVAQL